jgi:hypothetical protein
MEIVVTNNTNVSAEISALPHCHAKNPDGVFVSLNNKPGLRAFGLVAL